MKPKPKKDLFYVLCLNIFLRTILLLAVLVMFFPGQLLAEIYDGAHGGNQHFYFLPPLVPEPSPTGTFVGSLDPVVQVCEWTGTECLFPPIAEFTTTTGNGSERLRVVPEDEHYIVNCHLKRFKIDSTKTYRIRVLFRIEDEAIEKELGHLDVNDRKKTIPIKFRIEEGFFPIGELSPVDRAKISPVLQEKFISQDVVEPVEALINLEDNQIPMSELPGIEVLIKYKHLSKVYVLISDSATLASLVQSGNVKHAYENMKYKFFQGWQEIIGQNLTEISGYLGTGTAVAILDDGGATKTGFPLPDDDWLIDLREPEFGGCTDVGTPVGCRVVAMEDLWPNDPWTSGHMTQVAQYVALTAPGTDLIVIDVGAAGDADEPTLLLGLDWVLDHYAEYNIVAVNMSLGSELRSSTENCLEYHDDDFRQLRAAGIMPIAGSGNNGWYQHIFDGISHPACSPYVVSVGASDGASSFNNITTRGPDLDLLAPAGRTSFASPQVAGAWAVLRAALPDLSLEDTLELLKTTGVPIYDPESGYTFPRIQLDAALSAAGLPIIEIACPCFTADELNAIQWDIWCSGSTYEYLLFDATTNDPGPIVGADPERNPPVCFTGTFYNTIEHEITKQEAEACAELIINTAMNQGTEKACRID